ncbi:MAG TPA: TetR/AcrR family transcriptional regulator, partial [Candidatus Limnocylindria bacterium]|nr:TetR/AcrR family transcriptional regulator [Candidatus Limnocylindria bacterium]
MRAALDLADEGGIDALTMRGLAQAVGVEAMSLYYYFPNKDDILRGITDLVISEVDVPSGETNWKTAIRKSVTSYHDALARHPWAASLMISGMGPAHLRYNDALLRRLGESGLSPELTHHAYHALESHVVGSRLWAAGIGTAMKKNADAIQRFIRDLPVKEYPHFAEHVQQHVTKSVRASGKSEFEFGL